MSVPPFVFSPVRCAMFSARLFLLLLHFMSAFNTEFCPRVSPVFTLLLTFADNCRAFLHKPLLFGFRKYSRQRLHPASIRSNLVSFSSFHSPRVPVSVAGAAPLCKLSFLFVHRNVSSGIPALAVSFVARWGDRCFFVLRKNNLSKFIFSLSALQVFTSASCTREHSATVIHEYTLGYKAPNPFLWGLTNA